MNLLQRVMVPYKFRFVNISMRKLNNVQRSGRNTINSTKIHMYIIIILIT